MNTKLKGLLLVWLLLTYFNVQSQTVEIIPSYGYQFGTKLNYGNNYIKATDSDEFGISLGVEMAPNYMAGVSYKHQGTEMLIRDRIVSPTEDRLSDLAMDWIQLEATRYLKNDKIKPFVGAGVGMVIFSPSNENSAIVSNDLSSTTRLAFSLKGGINIMFTDRVGLNLQGDLLFPVEWGGIYVAAGSGGVSSGASVSSTTIIGGFSGGLVFRIGN
ncbi:MAG: hypothetical protein MUO53_17215 [Maribacter sp.]|nr:hypothetical protein [Maribacter sp.]